jgi:hypothetical protein
MSLLLPDTHLQHGEKKTKYSSVAQSSCFMIRSPACCSRSVHTYLYSVHASMYSVHTYLYSVHTSMQSVHTSMQSVHASMQSVHASMKSVHASMKSIHAHYMTLPAAQSLWREETRSPGCPQPRGRKGPSNAGIPRQKFPNKAKRLVGREASAALCEATAALWGASGPRREATCNRMRVLQCVSKTHMCVSRSAPLEATCARNKRVAMREYKVLRYLALRHAFG